MSNLKWSSEEIEVAITAAFSRLGYPTAKSEQLEAAKEFVKGHDSFVSLPTGSGSRSVMDACRLCTTLCAAMSVETSQSSS